ncbi:UBX domain-containing protein 1 [Morella rubra]|uniref:UBX domain-containing protein 1 n=1 Tax=Morella rubra TaxID=262757 RepID=A0A6A1VBQ7_9ROSI|nr:UBX domain-containing protein 1 [Morella rubra]
MESGAGTGISSGSGADMPVLEVNKKLLEELEAMGFPRARSTRALHYSGNSSLEEAINWVIDHENDLDIDQMPLVTMNIDLEPSQPFHITKQMKMKAQELRVEAKEFHVYVTGGGAVTFTEWSRKAVSSISLGKFGAVWVVNMAEKLMAAVGGRSFVSKANDVARAFLAQRCANKAGRYVAIAEFGEGRRRGVVMVPEGKGGGCWLGCSRRWSITSAVDRIRASKDLTKAKQIAEEDERKRHLALQKAEKEEEKRARDKILRKLEQDKVERRFRLGLPPERSAALNPSTALLQEYKTSLPVKFDTKAEPMRECLRTIKRNHQDRVGNLKGGIEFLELCGFEGTEGGNFLCLPREKVDMAALYTAGSELKSAMTNPFFGVLSRK